jgi:hypothetical protein
MSEESEQRRRQNLKGSLKGRVFTEEHRDNLSRAMKGKKRAPFSPEWVEKIAQASRNQGQGTRDKKREATLALWQTQEYRDSQMPRLQALWKDPEYRKKQNAARSSPEYRAQMRAASKKRWHKEG